MHARGAHLPFTPLRVRLQWAHGGPRAHWAGGQQPVGAAHVGHVSPCCRVGGWLLINAHHPAMIVWSWSTFSLVAGFILVAVATASVTGALVWRLVGNKDVVSSASTVQEVWPVLAAQDRATTDPFGDGQEELLRGRLTLKPKQGNAWLGGVFTPDAADTDAPLLVVQLEVQQPAEQEGAPPHRLLSWNSLEVSGRCQLPAGCRSTPTPLLHSTPPY